MGLHFCNHYSFFVNSSEKKAYLIVSVIYFINQSQQADLNMATKGLKAEHDYQTVWTIDLDLHCAGPDLGSKLFSISICRSIAKRNKMEKTYVYKIDWGFGIIADYFNTVFDSEFNLPLH